MEVYSKFRALFLIRKIFFFVIIFCFLMFFFFYDYSFQIELVVLSIVLFIVFIILTLINLNNAYHIIIFENYIKKISLITKNEDLFFFDTIQELSQDYVQGFNSDAGQITAGYSQTIIKLKNNRELIISPDFYKNYHELIFNIRNKCHKETI